MVMRGNQTLISGRSLEVFQTVAPQKELHLSLARISMSRMISNTPVRLGGLATIALEKGRENYRTASSPHLSGWVRYSYEYEHEYEYEYANRPIVAAPPDPSSLVLVLFFAMTRRASNNKRAEDETGQ